MVRAATAVDGPAAEAPKRQRRKTAEPVGQEVGPEVALEGNGRRPMSDGHKAALATGRDQGRAVRYYLEAIDNQPKPKRGRRRTPESIEKRLGVIEETFGHVDPLTKLHLAQERLNLEAELASLGGSNEVDIAALEDQFVEAAGPYSARKGIRYDAWRSMGVRPEVLRRAGIHRA